MDEIQWLLDLVKSMGVAGGPVFAVLWWLERLERKSCQKDSRETLIQVLTTTRDMTGSVVEVSKAVAEVGHTTKDVTDAIGKLGRLVRAQVGTRFPS